MNVKLQPTNQPTNQPDARRKVLSGLEAMTAWRPVVLYSLCHRWNRVSGSRVTGLQGLRFWSGHGSTHGSVCQTRCLTRIFSFNMRVYRGVVSKSNTISAN